MAERLGGRSGARPRGGPRLLEQTVNLSAISSAVEPEGFTKEADGSVTVDVHQVVRDARTSELISDSHVRHRYRLADGLVVRMDVVEQSDQR